MNLLSAAKNALKMRTGLSFYEVSNDLMYEAMNEILRDYIRLKSIEESNHFPQSQ